VIHYVCCRCGVVAKGDFGPGSGLTLLDDVKCQGTESSISQCQHRGWGVNNCGHSEDVGVICNGVKKAGKCYVERINATILIQRNLDSIVILQIRKDFILV
jgi:hypothetical protein